MRIEGKSSSVKKQRKSTRNYTEDTQSKRHVQNRYSRKKRKGNWEAQTLSRNTARKGKSGIKQKRAKIPFKTVASCGLSPSMRTRLDEVIVAIGIDKLKTYALGLSLNTEAVKWWLC